MYNKDEAPQFLREFLDYFATIKGRSPNTVRSYFHDIKLFLRFLMQKRGLADGTAFEEIDITVFPPDILKAVELYDILEFLHFLAGERGNSHKARHRRAVALRQFFKYLTNNKQWYEVSPATNLEIPGPRAPLPKSLTLEQAVGLLKSCETAILDADTYSGDWLSVRNYCIMTFFLNCGMRLSELVNMNARDFKRERNPDGGDDVYYINVMGKGSKERVVYLNGACITAHNLYIEKREELCHKHRQLLHEKAMFISKKNRRISPRQVEQIISDRLRSCGLDGMGFSVHKLRHTAATLMYRNGVDIRVLKEVLGHESLATTQIYTHVANEQMRQAVNNNPLSEAIENE
ncbi:MAG: tyrosine-type recombinase/integrase [Oscillospiraceae bacterium]|nr:tyrosine-type recombinase/integrase [Oscillospiraceae bacterium]